MNIYLTRHLYWVLWIWLLVAEGNGEDGLAKLEKRVVFKSETGPRGDTILQKSYLSTRTFSSSSSTVSSTDQTKPPDDRQSTTLSISSRARNESTVDLSRNTVPVLRSTEPGGGKYRRTTTSLPELRKSLAVAGKLKRLGSGVTRSRTADLTTLLAFNSLGPQQRLQQPPYPSTTQVAEAIPPTAWALASLRGPSTSKPGPHQVKPFINWSTRLSKTTTPSPTTELTEAVTNEEEPTIATETESYVTGEGVDNTATTLPVNESSQSSILSNNTTSSIKISSTTSATSTESLAPLTEITDQNETSPMSVMTNTDNSVDITSYKAEENTISVPPLSSLKNSTLDDFIEKKDISSKVQFVSNSETEFSHEDALESRIKTESVLLSTESQNLNDTLENLNVSTANEKTSIILVNSNSSEYSNISPPAAISEGPFTNVTVKEIIDNGPHNNETLAKSSQNVTATIISDTTNDFTNSTQIDTATFTSDSINDFISTQNTTENKKTVLPEVIEILESKSTEGPQYPDSLSHEVPVRRYDTPTNETIHEADPSLNTINEKKNDEGHSTSTVISTVNVSITMHVPSALTTPRNTNLTNLVEAEPTKGESQLEFAKHLPLTAETTTALPSTPEYDKNKNVSSQQDNYHSVINQTINDIKPFNDLKPVQVIPDLYTEKTSSIKPVTETRSNEIKYETSKNTSSLSDTKPVHQAPEPPETTQSNYIPDHEVIKPQNKTIDSHFKPPEDVTEKILISVPETASVSPTTMFEDTTTPPLFNTSISESMSPSVSPENITIGNDLGTTSTTSVTTPPPITTTPLPTTTFMPTDLSYSTESTLHSTSTKSNDISEHESTKHLSVPIPEKNMTQFQYESPNITKNESTTLIIQEPDETDEEGSFNHTDFGEKKEPVDNINNGDGDEDGGDDNFSDLGGNSTLHLNGKNVSEDVPSMHLTPTTSLPTTTKSSTTTPNIDIDEDPSNIDDDTIYDTGVITSVYIRMLFDATYNEMCREKQHLRDAIVRMFKKYAESRTIDKRQVQLMNLNMRDCTGLRSEMDQGQTPVQLYITDQQGQYDKTLNDIFLSLARQYSLEFKYPITRIEKVIGQHELTIDPESQPSGTVVAAIIISSIAGICLLALTILLVIMRKRQSGFNYGQRCTPVSLDDYSLDNISVYNSVRRKALRASKRSYGNPAFDDPDVISNPVNFAGLANMASNKSKTDEEFSNLPTVVVKPDELPPGADSKNRYANVIPLPETRVQLHGSTPEEQFINANYVKGVKEAEKCYIACQAPMQNTIEDFWRMIWDEQCRLIIMLTALTENGVEKCADYLPPSEVLDCHRIFGDLQVTLKKREAREKYVISSLQLKNLETNLWREVTHMWYAGWPATGVPAEPSSIIAFLIEARSYSKGAPIIVHCSPGTGRTGTVIAIDIAIRDFEAGRSVDIPKTVIQVRRGRAGAVQTKDQYNFIYKVLHFYATKLTGGGLDSI